MSNDQRQRRNEAPATNGKPLEFESIAVTDVSDLLARLSAAQDVKPEQKTEQPQRGTQLIICRECGQADCPYTRRV